MEKSNFSLSIFQISNILFHFYHEFAIDVHDIHGLYVFSDCCMEHTISTTFLFPSLRWWFIRVAIYGSKMIRYSKRHRNLRIFIICFFFVVF